MEEDMLSRLPRAHEREADEFGDPLPCASSDNSSLQDSSAAVDDESHASQLSIHYLQLQI